MSEWLKEHAWKACVQVTLHQGFESLPLRSALRYERQAVKTYATNGKPLEFKTCGIHTF